MTRYPPVALASLAAILVFALPLAAKAEEPQTEQVFLASADVHWIDYIRLFARGTRKADGAWRADGLIAMRHIGGADQINEAPKDFALDLVNAVRVMSGGKERLALLLDLGGAMESAEGFAVLALIDPAKRPRLLDIANVAYDRDTGFAQPAMLRIGDSDILLAVSRHNNSSQGYRTSAMIDLRGDRLTLIDTIFTFDDVGCGIERRQKPTFAIAGARAVRVSVTEAARRVGARCAGDKKPARAGTRTVGVTYRLDSKSGRFQADSDALRKFAEESESRF